MDLCRKGLAGEAHQILATDDIEAVSKNIFLFKPSIVLLNQYLKHGFIIWDVLRDIKIQDQNLPVLIVTKYATHLFDPDQADGYVVKSHTAASELRQKISALLGRGPAVQKTKEIKKIHDDKISDQE